MVEKKDTTQLKIELIDLPDNARVVWYDQELVKTGYDGYAAWWKFPSGKVGYGKRGPFVLIVDNLYKETNVGD